MAQPVHAQPNTLDEQLCFALYGASRSMTTCYRPLLDALGLTYPQYLVMLVLWERGSVTVTGVCTALHLETGTLSPLLKRLEGLGLVSRTRQAEDERSVLIALTAAGVALEDEAVAVHNRVVTATGMSHAEIAALRAVLHDLTARLRSAAIA